MESLYGSVIVAVVAIASLWWQIRQASLQRDKDRKDLEDAVNRSRRDMEERVAITERSLRQHLAEVLPLNERFSKNEREVAMTVQKTIDLEENVSRLIARVDRLLDLIMEKAKG